MEEKLVIRLSNNLGNQMFMYAAAFAAAKKLKKKLYIDKKSAYDNKNNIHFFSLDNFKLSSSEAKQNDLFVGKFGNIKRKLLKKIDKYRSCHQFILEKYNANKNTFYNNDILNSNFTKKVYMEGYFESEKYFFNEKKYLINEFSPKNISNYKNNYYLNELKNTESVALCVRQNRFSEKMRKINNSDQLRSKKFVDEQVKYIFNSISFFKSKLSNPIFYLWSNSFESLADIFKNEKVIFIKNKVDNKISKIHLDFYLMQNCKHYAVIPSAFNWWGCWLSKSLNSIILRPNDNHFTDFEVKNKDYWPESWIKI